MKFPRKITNFLATSFLVTSTLPLFTQTAQASIEEQQTLQEFVQSDQEFKSIPLPMFNVPRNKIIPEYLEWQEIHQDDFVLYYYKSEEELAQYVAKITKDLINGIEKKFDFEFKHRPRMLLYNSQIYFA